MHANSQGSHNCQYTPNWLWSMLLALDPTTVCVCNQLLPVHRQLQLAHTAECVHITSSKLPLLLDLVPSYCTKNPNSLCSFRGTFMKVTKTIQLLMLWTPVA